jgi:hypothetical protein
MNSPTRTAKPIMKQFGILAISKKPDILPPLEDELVSMTFP